MDYSYICNEMVDYNEMIDDNETIIIDDESISTIDTETESFDGSELEFAAFDDIWDAIFEYEERSFDDALINGKYIIGMPGYERNTNEWLYLSGISTKGFYKFNLEDVLKYLHEYSLSYVHKPNIHIMKLYTKNDGTCNVVLKTFWLKIIQRKWKKVYKERQKYIRKMRNPMNLFARELGVHFHCPSLYGMLIY